MGMVDNTLFTKKKSSNLIIVQIYVDDIIFGSTCQDMCDDFAKIMHDEFKMSMMGELNFFLGLQIKQMKDGIFFNQSKYIKEMLKKFGLEDSKPMKTPMSSDTKLTKDEECESVDSTKYRGMIGVPCEGACVFTDKWALYELANGLPGDGPYQTFLPYLDDIITLVRVDREGPVTRTRHNMEIDVIEYQVLTREIDPTFKDIEAILIENVFGMEWVSRQSNLILPYGMFLTKILTHILNENPELQNPSYVLYDRVMEPLSSSQERKPRKDRGTRKGRTSTSLTPAFGEPSLSHPTNDDEDVDHNEGTSHASTPSPVSYVNSLTNQVPQVFQNPPNIDPHLEPFYTRQTEIINRQVQIRDEHRGGVRSIEKSLRRLWRNLKK
ncbi:retrovirus-related pol polyprotein from transposon TNT 1-94 [Tanacetum coccineum]|uniref:Retrovirus-related pol polyprotein from transposon TNT 1-94 n=1 Tax=Tanacetum coccineum TaxID=301880 RepID=A0ABQ5BMF9_9ASTR